MEIKMVSINELKPYKSNPRNNVAAVSPVAESIKAFGFKQPIVIDKNNEIVAGHTRLLAAKKLKLQQVPCVIASDLTDDEIKAYRLADNKTHDLSEWDLDLLNTELCGIFDFDMSVFGFADEIKTAEPIEDNFDINANLPEVPVSKEGDIWILGSHRLMCGDAANHRHVSELMGGIKADLILTDPPYNMNYRGSGGLRRKGIANDNLPEHEFTLLLKKAFDNYFAHSNKGAAGYCFYKELGGGVFLETVRQSGFTFKQQCVWIKNQAVLGGLAYQGMHEPFIMFCNKTAAKWHGGRKQKSVVEDVDFMERDELVKLIKHVQTSDFNMIADAVREDKPLKSELHPTMKPVRLLAKLIHNSSDKGDAVLDLFGGSGSTLIACEQTGRNCFMTELNPRYVDVIVKRWELFTKMTAAKIH